MKGRHGGEPARREFRLLHDNFCMEQQMANGSGGDGGTPVLAFILGGAIVIIAVFGFFVYNGHHGAGAGNGIHVTENVTKH